MQLVDGDDLATIIDRGGPLSPARAVEIIAQAAKAATVLLCTIDTLVTDGSSISHLWADDLHLSPNGHAYIGSLAASRTRANPF